MIPASTKYRFALPRTRQTLRRGVTLSEVLVSLLVMSIGVVALATLFPISVLRSVQATQLTNATQLRYNFDGLTGPRPDLIAGAGEWQPVTNYLRGDLVSPSIGSDRFYECMTAGTSGAIEPNWNSTVGGPTTENVGGSNNPVWATHRARVYMVDPIGWQERTKELRDIPLTPAANTVDLRNTFGRLNLATTPATLPLDSPWRIVRLRGGSVRNNLPAGIFNPDPSSSTFFPAEGSPADIAARIGARNLDTLPDSWVFQAETNAIALASPVGTAPVRINLDQSVTPTQLVPTLDVNSDAIVNLLRGQPEQLFVGRAILTNTTGKLSVIRPINVITIPAAGIEQIELSGPALPTLVAPDDWVKVRIETFEERYTWLLAVRRQSSGAAYMNLVVFFRRNFDPQYELIHPAQFRLQSWPGVDNTSGTADDVADLKILGSSYTPILVGGADAALNTPDDVPAKPMVVVQYNAALPAGQGPFLKKGGFICDAQNNRWYRVLSYTEVPDARAALLTLHPGHAGTTLVAGQRGAVVWLDTPMLEGSGAYTASLPTGAAEPPGGALMMPGVVDVYPLLPQLPWEN